MRPIAHMELRNVCVTLCVCVCVCVCLCFIWRLFHFAINCMTACPHQQIQTATSESNFLIYRLNTAGPYYSFRLNCFLVLSAHWLTGTWTDRSRHLRWRLTQKWKFSHYLHTHMLTECWMKFFCPPNTAGVSQGKGVAVIFWIYTIHTCMLWGHTGWSG